MQFSDGEVNTVSKVRGITLNCKASQLMNFDTIKDLVINRRSNSTVTVRMDKKSNESGTMVRVYP